MMDATRRRFLKMVGAVAAGLALPGSGTVTAGDRGTVPGRREPLTARTWAMVVDLKRCRAAEGCRECVLACHGVHNVPEPEDAGTAVWWISVEPFASVFPDLYHDGEDQKADTASVPVFCCHCANPPCVRVCPTRATFLREDGIVMMDYHRCIGCRYCMAACPYGSRSFNFRDPRPLLKEIRPGYPARARGVVEKCNLCAERLDAGLLPACVEACPHGALACGDLADPGSEIRHRLRTGVAVRRKADLGTEPKVYYLV